MRVLDLKGGGMAHSIERAERVRLNSFLWFVERFSDATAVKA